MIVLWESTRFLIHMDKRKVYSLHLFNSHIRAAVLRIHISIFADPDPDPGKDLNADPDADPDAVRMQI
jgi:hypothetical protein